MWVNLKRLLNYTWKYKWMVITGTVTTLVTATMVWLSPRIVSNFIEEGLLPQSWERAKFWIACIAAAEILRLACQASTMTLFSKISYKVMGDLREQLNRHLHRVPVSMFDRMPSGRIMTRVAFDVGSISDFYQSGFISIIGNILAIAATWIGIFQISFDIGILLFAIFIPMVLVCVYFSDRLKKNYELSRAQLSTLNAHFADFLNGMKTIRALGLKKIKYGILKDGADKFGTIQFGISQTFALLHPTISLAIGLMMIVVVSKGSNQISEGTLSLGHLSALLTYIGLLFNPLVEMTDRWNFFVQGVTAIDRIQEIVKEQIEQDGVQKAPPFLDLELKDVSFSYSKSGKDSVLNNFNLKISRGDWIGIHGPSGSGKSTLLQLILAFENPSQGQVSWNGSSYLDFKRQTLRRKFGLVEQFPQLFAGSVEDNITCFGNVQPNWKDLEAELSEFPLAYSVVSNRSKRVEEKGNNLSMGERQMLAFIRALVTQPEIWVLDEATAFFDLIAEKECLDILERYRSRGITVIQVAHRQSVLKQMTRKLSMFQPGSKESESNHPV